MSAMAPGAPSVLEAADAAARPLRAVLEDAWLTMDDPVLGDGRWFEIYQGAPADPVFVCVDAMSNVLHVRFDEASSLTVSYLPGWCYEAATAARADRWPDPPAVLVKDLAAAQPLVFELRVENPIDGTDRSVVVDGQRVGYASLPIGYTFSPARNFEIEERKPRSGRLVHWSAMRLLLAMAPGVSYSARPLLGAAALTALRAAYRLGDGPVTCDQSLAFEIQRHRHPGTLPPLGGPLRPVALPEADLVAGSVAMELDIDGGGLLPTTLQQVRTDGIDLQLLRPDLRSPHRGTPWSWQPDWFVTAGTVLDDLAFTLVKEVFDTAVEWLGGLPEAAPLPIRIRVDPLSAEDRFAYRVDLLDDDGEPTSSPFGVASDGPVFQVTVVRTKTVRVFLDKAVGEAGTSDLTGIVRYREEVVDFADVPLELTADRLPPVVDLPIRDATATELLHVVDTVGQFIPVPAVQVMYNLRDLGTVASYVLTGKDLYGEPMSGLAAAITLGGVLVPPVLEKVGGTLLAAGRRVLCRGEVPLPRLIRAVQEDVPVDAELAAIIRAKLPPVTP
jgi:hypothetical protein